MEKTIATIKDTDAEVLVSEFVKWAEEESTQMIQIRNPEDE
jgi:hypothetical protein